MFVEDKCLVCGHHIGWVQEKEFWLLASQLCDDCVFVQMNEHFCEDPNAHLGALRNE